MTKMLTLREAAETTAGDAEGVYLLEGDTYRDLSCAVVCPSRGMVHLEVVNSWNSLVTPRNQRHSKLFCTGHEVGVAYNEFIKTILGHPRMSKYKFLLTVEDDNVLPPQALMRLLDRIHERPEFDAIGALYYAKCVGGSPMAYGDPAIYEASGYLDFRPRDVRGAVERGELMEVNGLAMGCTLYRMDLFREIEAPWFVTVNEFGYDGELKDGVPIGTRLGIKSMTQDLSFCMRAREKGKRFAVDCGLRVGHLDIETGVTY
jgi:hypothetical protein